MSQIWEKNKKRQRATDPNLARLQGKRLIRRKKKRRKQQLSFPFEKNRLKKMISAALVITAVTVGFSFYRFISRAEVMSHSMEPTLSVGDKVTVIKNKKPKHFDLVVFEPPHETGESYVKRVIGLPGDKVEYRQDILYLNGQSHEEPYLAKKYNEFKADYPNARYTPDFSVLDVPGIGSKSKEVPAGMYLVLGDNRRESEDSREFGLVPQANLRGIVWQKNK